jgi:RNA recognition motif-containing protein
MEELPIMRIYVGNLNYNTTDETLLALFQEHGEVESASVIKDNFTGRSRGFGFVEMPDSAEAQKAIEALNGKEVEGRALKVNEARPKGKRGGPRRGGRGGGGGRDRY